MVFFSDNYLINYTSALFLQWQKTPFYNRSGSTPESPGKISGGKGRRSKTRNAKLSEDPRLLPDLWWSPGCHIAPFQTSMRFCEALGLGAVSVTASFHVLHAPPGHSHVDIKIKIHTSGFTVGHPVDNKNRAVMRIKNIQAYSQWFTCYQIPNYCGLAYF